MSQCTTAQAKLNKERKRAAILKEGLSRAEAVTMTLEQELEQLRNQLIRAETAVEVLKATVRELENENDELRDKLHAHNDVPADLTEQMATQADQLFEEARTVPATSLTLTQKVAKWLKRSFPKAPAPGA